MIFIGPLKRETANKLARRCNTVCYDIEDQPPHIDDFVVNYGGNYPDANLNPFLFKNKLTQYDLLKELGRSPKIWTRLDDIPDEAFPILARRKYSSRGRNVAYLKDREAQEYVEFPIQFYERYIQKDREFRVHILGEKSIVTEKIKCNPEDDNFVFGHLEGFYQRPYEGGSKEKLSQIAKDAIKAVGYDFGAVDIILGKQDNKFYILEVNSAPCLLRWMRRIYAKYFKDEERKWLEERR